MLSPEEPAEVLVPDPAVWREFGVTSMTLYRWSRDKKLDFPPAVKINGRNFRSRRLLEDFKARLLREAIASRAA
jgi:predicted DNA-binding transcriptional regulator AlpA